MSTGNNLPLLCFAHYGEAGAFLSNAKRQPCGIVDDFFESDIGLILITKEGVYDSIQSLTTILTLNDNISRVYNLGVAGGLSKQLNLNDIVEVRTVYAGAEAGFEFKSFTLNNEETYDCITAHRRIDTEKGLAPLRVIAQLVDRELWGIAKTCHHFSKPLRAFKVISDFANDGSTCSQVKDQAEIFSQRLYEHFSFLPEYSARREDQADLPTGFYFTLSQKELYSKLLSRLRLKFAKAEREIIDDLKSEIASNLKPKEKTSLLLKRMNEILNPHRVILEKRIDESLAQLRNDSIQVTYDKTFETVDLDLRIRVHNENNLRDIIDKLNAFDYSKFKNAIDWHED